jgi:hypothetical protein
MNNTRRLWLMTLMSVGMIFSYGTSAEEDSSAEEKLTVADEFKQGDVISADTFNQIFRTIEKINKQAEDDDLVGTWTCNALTTRNTGISGWENKGLFYVLEDAQVNFISSDDNDSQTSPYTITTSSPSPIRLSSDAFSGTYSLVKNTLFTKFSSDTQSRIFNVDIVSPKRIELVFQETSAQSFPANYASYIDCVVTNAVPASPISPTATNNKTGINLAWTDASSDEAGFKVYRKLSTETEAKVIATQTAVTYSDTDLTEGQTAYYQVTAYNNNGDSVKSKTVSATLDSISPTLVSVNPPNGAALTDADADFTGGDKTLINGISATRNGGGEITISLTFSEEIRVTCQYSSSMPTMCSGDSAVKFKGLNNTYSFLGAGTTGTTFSTTIPFTPNYGSNPDTFTISVNAARIEDRNGNTLGADFVSTFSVSDTNTYGSKAP